MERSLRFAVMSVGLSLIPVSVFGSEPERSPAGLVFHDEFQAKNSEETKSEEMKIEPKEEAPHKMFQKAEMRRKGVQEIALIASDLGFFPNTVFLSRDIPVKLYVTGASKNTLCFMLDLFQVQKQVRSNKIEEISFTPTQPGKFRFYCPVNGMEGTLIVKELALN